jgi:hypothetical protein
MDPSIILPKIILVIIGVVLIVAGFRGMRRIYPYSSFREYYYISRAERFSRSIKAAVYSLVELFGISFIILPLAFWNISLGAMLMFAVGFGLCVSIFVFPLAFFRMYRELVSFTKQNGDIVSAEDEKNLRQ